VNDVPVDAILWATALALVLVALVVVAVWGRRRNERRAQERASVLAARIAPYTRRTGVNVTCPSCDGYGDALGGTCRPCNNTGNLWIEDVA
jgi:hypothetical protein